jgi:hypothetical protein
MSEIERFVLRVPTAIMTRMRALAKKHDRSLNGEYLQAVRVYLGMQAPAGRTRTMRWVIDGVEYDTKTARAIAHGGSRSRYEEPEEVLYRTPDGEYFAVTRLEDRGSAITAFDADDAQEAYLGFPVHLVDEDDAFPPETWASANAEDGGTR